MVMVGVMIILHIITIIQPTLLQQYTNQPMLLQPIIQRMLLQPIIQYMLLQPTLHQNQLMLLNLIIIKIQVIITQDQHMDMSMNFIIQVATTGNLKMKKMLS